MSHAHRSCALVLALVLAACGGDGDEAAFCERLDRLTENDPFLAFGDTASEAEMEQAFIALRERAEELAELAPEAAEGAATDYHDAVVGLDELLAEAGYGIDVDPVAYQSEQLRYVEAAERLERYLETSC